MKYYDNHNQKALDIVNNYKDQIFSYLMAKPGSYNHITTIPTKDRNETNGYANFLFQVNELVDGKFASTVKYNVRVETCTFGNDLIIEASKARNIEKCDLLIFEYDNTVFISERDENGRRSWLYDKKYYSQKTIQWPNSSPKTYNHYKLANLVCHNLVVQLIEDSIENKVVVINDLSFLFPEKENTIYDTRIFKELNDYNIDTSHIERVQYDGKTAGTVFWNYKCYRYTSNLASTTKLAYALSLNSTEKAESIYRKILRAYKNTISTGKAYTVKVKASKKYLEKINHLQADSATINEKEEITIVVSDNPEFDIFENKLENITDNKNCYQKVYLWLKRNPNKRDFPKKWSDEEMKIAEDILRGKEA